jgi:hypothetical protein
MDETQFLSLLSVIALSAAVVVAVVYYILASRDTNKTRQAELFMRVCREISNPVFLDKCTDLMNAEWKNDEEGYQKITSPTTYKSFWQVLTFFEGIGVLIRQKLVDVRLVALLMAGATRRYWEKLGPVVLKLRKEIDYPRCGSETEYLYTVMMEYMEKHPELKT